MLNTATTYSRLLELLTARDYAERHEPYLLDLLTEPEAALREDTARAESVATLYNVPPARDMRYTLAVWDLVRPAGTPRS
jgi:hypothetical protein